MFTLTNQLLATSLVEHGWVIEPTVMDLAFSIDVRNLPLHAIHVRTSKTVLDCDLRRLRK